jgi:hypothetical protein
LHQGGRKEERKKKEKEKIKNPEREEGITKKKPFPC